MSAIRPSSRKRLWSQLHVLRKSAIKTFGDIHLADIEGGSCDRHGSLKGCRNRSIWLILKNGHTTAQRKEDQKTGKMANDAHEG